MVKAIQEHLPNSKIGNLEGVAGRKGDIGIFVKDVFLVGTILKRRLTKEVKNKKRNKMDKFNEIEERVKKHDRLLQYIKDCVKIIAKCTKPYDIDSLNFYGISLEGHFGEEVWNNIREDLKAIIEKELVIFRIKSEKLQQEIVNL